MNSLENLIKEKYSKLSPGQKRVAEYLIQNRDEFAFNTASQIGRKVDVSETTVIRFSYAIGFNGFSEMQSHIQQWVLSHSQGAQPPTEISNAEQGTSEISTLFARTMEKEVVSMRQTLKQLNQEEVWKVIGKLIEADRVLVVGMRASFAAAYWFSLQLHTLRDQVYLSPTAGNVYEQLSDLTEHSAVVILSFPRYLKETLHLAESVKSQGIPIICLTDRLLSPVGRIADFTLTTEENVESDSPSIHPVISVIDMIISGIAMKDQERVQMRQQKLEEVYSTHGVFIE
ncbi:MurR/RpiR family transcriptional regulator [Ammoniphilus sp. CFH 90114]|uniref:MurR/RpiR family transcriptional regulator n=1 Tax=Ammoniphilus sp. CFH 90114 TaxID=2493665 RepID=UPI00100E4768|nr:MurR/RpiR family transcriptional regulator [Ammoniphilus sp. CFH 90114]RXT06478.1 MurR/RpiR family transcriptional regulator [Ammoniphilus sp. CFH 90114]